MTGKDGKTIVEGDNKVTFQDGTQNVTLKAGYNSKTKTITLDFPAEYQLNAFVNSSVFVPSKFFAPLTPDALHKSLKFT